MNLTRGGRDMSDNTINLGDEMPTEAPKPEPKRRKVPEPPPTGLLPDEYEVDRRSDVAAAEKMPERTVLTAVKLRLRGASYPEIAEFCGYVSPASARVAVETHVGQMYATETDFKAMRAIASERYTQLVRSLHEKATNSKVRETITLSDGTEKTILVDNPDHLAYAREFRATLDSINRLHGLNAPQISMQVTPESEKFEEVVSMVTDLYRQANDSEEADVFADEEDVLGG